MRHSLLSLFVFAFYTLGLSLGLLVFPNFFLPLVDIPKTNEVWVRAAGMLLLGYSVYYFCVVRAAMVAFLRFTVLVRSLVIVFFASFVALGWAPWTFLVFGVIDLAAAIWTALALRAEGESLLRRNTAEGD